MAVTLTKKEKAERPDRERLDDIEAILKALESIGISRDRLMRVFGIMDEKTQDELK